MRRGLGVIVAGFLLTVVAGCGGRSSGGVGPPEAGLVADGPVALIGSWRVTEARGEEPGAVLRVAAGELALWRRCGKTSGSWRANVEGLFVGDLDGTPAACDIDAPSFVPAWLRQAARFRIEADARLLLDRRGGVVARLLPGWRPTAGAEGAGPDAEPPVVDDKIRAEFRPAAPLPAGLVAAAPGQLVGRWVPADGRGSKSLRPALAELTAEGEWHGSDGCNGLGGRWAAGAGGTMLAVTGPSTLIGCDNVNIGGWLSDVARAGFDGDLLVLVDRSGTELGRLKAAG
jgi:hypothetical protein